ncbi:unnamed protein product, partial [Didymodactylos carnosus]
ENPSSAPLEPNHTHFILLDKGNSIVENIITTVAAKIEEKARNIMTQATAISMVQILVEGGIFSIDTVCEAVSSGVPLIVIDVSYELQ